MKKTITFLLILALSLSVFACGNNDNTNNEADNGNTATQSNEKKLPKDIDAVADYLGLGEGTETNYSAINAKAGKEYKDGSIKIYQFDENSEAYENIKDGKGSIKASAHEDGFILEFTGNVDNEILEKFETIDFD